MKRAVAARWLSALALLAALWLLASPAVTVLAAPKPPPATPVAPPTPRQPAAVEPAPSSSERWVQNFEVTELWSGPNEGAVFFGWLRKFSYLRIERADGNSLYVLNPRSNNFAYVNASVVGPSGPPPPDYLEPLKVLAKVNLPGRTVGTTNLYAEPAADDGVWLRTVGHNLAVTAVDEVKGDGGSWYRLDTGEFISGDHLRLPGPPAARYSGKWIDADLNEPTLLTAYEGNRPVASALAIHGVAKWATPVGTFSIMRRV